MSQLDMKWGKARKLRMATQYYFLGVLWVSSLITDEKMGAPGDKEHTSRPKTRKLKSQISNPSLSDPKVLAFLLLF